MKPTLLAIETATEYCSVALSHQGQVHSIVHKGPREHANQLLPSIEQVLLDAGITLQALDAFVASIGPGSFTGVRIGIAVTQGLAYGAQKPIVPISTLAIMAQGYYEKTGITSVAVALDARIGEVYYGEYQLTDAGMMQCMLSPCVIGPADIATGFDAADGVHGIGPGWQVYESILAQRVPVLETQEYLPTANASLALAEYEFSIGKTVQAADLMPLYCRNQVVRK